MSENFTPVSSSLVIKCLMGVVAITIEYSVNTMAKQLEGYERYRQFMDRLTESNVDDYIDLPMIAVMGDTSSGKSSLLSNISLVDLPSADSLTTRCPIMLKMHNAQLGRLA